MPVQDCLLVNNMQEGCFRLTVQRLADTHDITINIVFPTNPQTGDIHLVDYDGDNWWVVYRYGAGTWNIQAEIEGGTTPDLSAYALNIDNVPKVIWVNSESDPAYSAVHNPNKPFTTLADAIAEIPAGLTVDTDLDAILGNIDSYHIKSLPNVYTVKLVGDSYYLTTAELDTIDTDRSFKLFLESGLKLQALADLGVISQDIIDISGPGFIYKNAMVSTDPLLTLNSTVTNLNVDLRAIYFKSVSEAGPALSTLAGPIFRLDNSTAEVNISIKELMLNTAMVAVLPGEFNRGTNIKIDKIFTPSSGYVALFKFPEVSLGSIGTINKSTNINIGQFNSEGIGTTLFYGRPNSLYGYQDLNITIDQLEATEHLEWPLTGIFGGDYTGSNINIRIKQSYCSGPYFIMRNNSTFNGNYSLHVENDNQTSDSGYSPYLSYISGGAIASTGRVSFSGNYRSKYLFGDLIAALDNFFIEGNYYISNNDYPGFLNFNGLNAGAHKIYLNNCKIIGDTAESLVHHAGTPAVGTVTLVCSNVHTNMMGALPVWVTIEGDLTQNVNYL